MQIAISHSGKGHLGACLASPERVRNRRFLQQYLEQCLVSTLKASRYSFELRDEVLGNHCRSTRQSWLVVGCLSQIDSTGRMLFAADAHRDNEKRFILTAHEKLTAFLELERQLSKAAGMIKRAIDRRAMSSADEFP